MSRIGRWLLRGVAALAAAGCLTLLVLYILVQRTALQPPEVSAAMQQQMAVPGPGHAERVRDIWLIWLSGPPEVRGADMHRLVGDAMARIDATMHETFADIVPNPVVRLLVEWLGRYSARHLSQDIAEDVQREIAGQMWRYDDRFGDGGGKYSRFLSYLALHDLAQTIEQSPLIACTGFAVAGARSASGKTLVGRNFDFEAGPVFDREKAVTVMARDGAFKIASVAWPGMNGVVTGINERRVWISVNAARSDDELPRGTPVSLVIRAVLEQATSARDAAKRLQDAKVRVADFYLIADPVEAFVLEKTPVRSVLRDAADSGGAVVVANHFLDPSLRAERRNLRLEETTTSRDRFARLDELVRGAQAALSPMDALAMLRDRRQVGGAPYAPTDRRALDAFIATHGVIADLGSDVLYVSRAPHLSETWLGLELGPLFEGRAELAAELPADAAALATGLAQGYRKPGE